MRYGKGIFWLINYTILSHWSTKFVTQNFQNYELLTYFFFCNNELHWFLKSMHITKRKRNNTNIKFWQFSRIIVFICESYVTYLREIMMLGIWNDSDSGCGVVQFDTWYDGDSYFQNNVVKSDQCIHIDIYFSNI